MNSYRSHTTASFLARRLPGNATRRRPPRHPAALRGSAGARLPSPAAAVSTRSSGAAAGTSDSRGARELLAGLPPLMLGCSPSGPTEPAPARSCEGGPRACRVAARGRPAEHRQSRLRGALKALSGGAQLRLDRLQPQARQGLRAEGADQRVPNEGGDDSAGAGSAQEGLTAPLTRPLVPNFLPGHIIRQPCFGAAPASRVRRTSSDIASRPTSCAPRNL